MMDVIDRLLERAAGAEPEVRVRLRSRFEPEAEPEGAPTAGTEWLARPAAPAATASPSSVAAVDDDAAGDTQPAPARPDQTAGPARPRAGMPGGTRIEMRLGAAPPLPPGMPAPDSALPAALGPRPEPARVEETPIGAPSTPPKGATAHDQPRRSPEMPRDPTTVRPRDAAPSRRSPPAFTAVTPSDRPSGPSPAAPAFHGGTAAGPPVSGPAGEGSRGEAEAGPSRVEVHIGRIEVSVARSPTPGERPKRGRARPSVGLSDYLGRGSRGGGER